VWTTGGGGPAAGGQPAGGNNTGIIGGTGADLYGIFVGGTGG
jgi:hypothetical protein